MTCDVTCGGVLCCGLWGCAVVDCDAGALLWFVMLGFVVVCDAGVCYGMWNCKGSLNCTVHRTVV